MLAVGAKLVPLVNGPAFCSTHDGIPIFTVGFTDLCENTHPGIPKFMGGGYFYDTRKEKEVAMDTMDVGKGKQIDYR